MTIAITVSFNMTFQNTEFQISNMHSIFLSLKKIQAVLILGFRIHLFDLKKNSNELVFKKKKRPLNTSLEQLGKF